MARNFITILLAILAAVALLTIFGQFLYFH
jgi:hypothetical protein